MLSHAGLALFVITLALLLARLAAVRIQTRQTSVSASSHAQPGMIDLQAAGEGHRIDLALWMRVLVTLAVLASALFIVLSKHYEADQQKWAFGVVGTVLGYWLKR